MRTFDNFLHRESREAGEAGLAWAKTEDDDDVDEVGSRRRTTRLPIFQQFIWVVDRTYECTICREKYPNSEQGRIKRPADGSTYPFWMHYKRAHWRIHDALKGKENPNKQNFIAENAEGHMEVQKWKKRVFRGLNAEKTKDVITRFVCATDSLWSIVDHETFREMWRYATQANIDLPTAKVINHFIFFIYSFHLFFSFY